ncbi:MAG: ATP-binding cassette domain-containing protein [Actinomycetota bacterium]|nr:ATP-binding cassette domain-containing protein [Actinomycetota bacterium]
MEQPELFTLTRVTVQHLANTVLDEVSLRITAGCTALLGASGAGKTTLLRLLTRLDEPASGQITFRGTPLAALDVRSLRRRVQLLAQHPVLLADTVLDELRIGAPRLTEAEAGKVLRQAALPPEGFLHRFTTGLSGGEAQRLCLARSLTLHPEVLLLDEPTSALDAHSAAGVMATVRQFVVGGGSVVLVSHDRQLIDSIAEQVVILDRGRVTDTGRPDETSEQRSGS